MSMFAWDGAAPTAWELYGNCGSGDGRLRLGTRVYRLDDIVSFESSSMAEINIDGHLIAVGLFLAAGCLFLLPVAMNIAHPRFLAGSMLFFGIGAMILVDIRQGHRSIMHRVQLQLADGSIETFASTDAAICSGLAAALTAHRNREARWAA